MAQPATTPKIEELRFRLKTDAKSRIFYPLAEELRKVGQFTEAEQVLRSGLGNHPSYLSAWVSLGRVQRELKDHHGAVESLSKALQLDPGNVVAARLLADAYLALGEKLEALKKYKLVHALLPGEEDLEAIIDQLDNELNPITLARAEETAPAAAPAPPPAPIEENPFSATAPEDAAPWAEPEAPAAPPPVAAAPETPDASPGASFDAGDSEPMHLAHTESPFEEPVAETYSSAAVEIEAPGGFHVDAAPLSAEVPASPVFPSEESDVFAPADAVAPEPVEDITNTLTMADLYARQGLNDDARHIFETILQRDPGNTAVREKLDALNAPAAAPEPELSPFAPEPEAPSLFADTEPEPEPEPMAEPEPVAVPPAVVMQKTPARAKVARLESWLKKVGGAEVKGV